MENDEIQYIIKNSTFIKNNLLNICLIRFGKLIAVVFNESL